MGVYLNPGNELFRMDINSQIYVDKTELIENTNRLIGSQQRFVCVSRPRRFGKSMTANMLAAYYGRDCSSAELFDCFRIANSCTYREHLNKYHVIALNMQNFFSLIKNVGEAIEFLQSELLEELTEYFSVVSGKPKFLAPVLEKIYNMTMEGFVFVIDEWDCVLRDKSYIVEDQKKYLDFLRNLLKDRAYVTLAYMTGILPVKKYGTHSALNMFIEYSMTEPRQFASYVGFTEQEVVELCDLNQMDYAEMQSWYDGYVFPKVSHIYNPKSVVEAILSKHYSNYWTRTETFEALKVYIKLNYDGLKESVVQMLAGKHLAINTRSFQNDMMTFDNKDDILTLLVHLGYLSFDQEKSEVFIPNKEIQDEFETAVRSCKWQEVISAIENSDKILQATWNMEEEKVANLISKAHSENTSILTYNDENALSCVVALAYYSAQNEYTRIREFPGGEGFADIVFLPRKSSNKPALVVELKYNRNASGAIEQIRKKKYAEALSEYKGNMLLVGINYDRKSKEHECRIERFYKE